MLASDSREYLQKHKRADIIDEKKFGGATFTLAEKTTLVPRITTVYLSVTFDDYRDKKGLIASASFDAGVDIHRREAREEIWTVLLDHLTQADGEEAAPYQKVAADFSRSTGRPSIPVEDFRGYINKDEDLEILEEKEFREVTFVLGVRHSRIPNFGSAFLVVAFEDEEDPRAMFYETSFRVGVDKGNPEVREFLWDEILCYATRNKSPEYMDFNRVIREYLKEAASNVRLV